MATSSLQRLLARRRVRHYMRRAGWLAFFAGAGWTLVSNTLSNVLVIWPLIAGVLTLALTQGAARVLKRYSSTVKREGRSSSSSTKMRRVRIKTSGAASRPIASTASVNPATLADYERGGETGYEPGRARARVTADPRGGVMRRARKGLVYAAIALPVLALVAMSMSFDDEPLVTQSADVTMGSYERAQQLMETHDPRKPGASGLRTIVASQEEVNLVASYAAKRFGNATARVALRPGAAHVQASVPAKWSLFGDWMNVDAVLRETQGVPTIEKLRVGSLPVPAFVADFALDRALSSFGATERGRVARDMVKSVSLEDSKVRVVYEWREDLLDRARAALVPQEDQERFRAYSARLAEVVERAPSGRPSIGVAQLLPPLFALAKQRSARGDAAKENRAAIITLTFYAFGKDLSTIIPAASAWRTPMPLEVTLYDRDDSAQHFLVSAALAIEGGSPLSNAIGLYREVEDSRRTGAGKGFSFQDLAADRAGTRFGQIAAQSPERLQAALSANVKESDFMPPFSDFAEEIPEAEFKRKYGGVGSPAYNNVLADIEARVARTPLLR